jgi:hypothetical protein
MISPKCLNVSYLLPIQGHTSKMSVVGPRIRKGLENAMGLVCPAHLGLRDGA